ncbi:MULTISPECIES: HNH endonuclease [Roseomonas]|uniref:Phage endonuclease n=1 Tax=Roseomonas mucosa TaxID=207340 RepID=A0A4Y1N4S3_9PROT|nr:MULTISPECIES: HNH endonuclease [Roseomonas]AWV24703.1 Phage endonuclease [Roseomonas mucosa]MDT8277658.1 HNH endonuclease [Roseomonas mucosa]MDT8353868.1 HNH endonuclease [Roseomonas mucosa]SUE43019.1 HNH endonuclease [Roseomonas gilardii subsp. rosea]
MTARFYGTAEWKRLRAEVIRRQPVCATPGCGGRSAIADHIVPRRQGGADALSNLRGLCMACHNQRVQAGREPRAKGCHEDGTPRDTRHWWAQEAAENRSGLGRSTGGVPPRRVSSGEDDS